MKCYNKNINGRALIKLKRRFNLVDYSLKAKVLESGVHIIQRKMSLMTFLLANQLDGKKPLTMEEYEALRDLWFDSDAGILLREANKINNASYHRRKRLASRIGSMLVSGSCIFLTITFSNDTLNKTSKDTRRKYVTRFLKSCCSQYVANIDYGSKNHREHYHALVLCDNVDSSLWAYGSVNFERVKVLDSTKTKLAKYICKLTNHAIKETTQKSYCIYSKSQGE